MSLFAMKKTLDPRIVASDRLDNALVVSFDNGKTGLYSAAFLYAALSQAQIIESSDSELEQIHLIRSQKP
jgi:hypothetical protein